MTANQDHKQRMEDLIKWQLQIFERGQTFSTAMIVAGYAGIFGLWSFARPVLNESAVDIVALLVGISLFIYISWELYGMILRANSTHRFLRLITKQPSEFFPLFDENQKIDQSISAKLAHRWKWTVSTAGVLAYLGGLLLLWDVLANLFHFRQIP